MNISVTANHIGGTVQAIASKSYAHRLLICAAFSSQPVNIRCQTTSKDIEATAACLRALGAGIERKGDVFAVQPIDQNVLPKQAVLDCGESGSTFRFMLPIVCALGLDGTFLLHGKLAERPLSPLYEELVSHGAVLSPQGSPEFHVSGKLSNPSFTIPGNVSSQFISGLLFALVLMGGGSVDVTEHIESESYIQMTIDCLQQAGVIVSRTDQTFTVSGGYQLPQEAEAEGDWSNAAMWLCAGCVSRKPITVTGLNLNSIQGDRGILDVLESFGAQMRLDKSAVTVSPASLHGAQVNAANIPDLVPVISALSTGASGETKIVHAERLRLKESDRLAAMSELIQAFGGNVTETADGLIINGGKPLHSADVSSWNDHRIVMAAVIVSMVAKQSVLIRQAEAIEKSYPGFFRDLEALGGNVEVTE